ncbi:MAG: phytoene desaturase family protein [Actinomycetota bacterium]
MRILSGVEEADVVVVGGGPNGLICSNYLARCGLEVVVVEAGARLGGGLSTEEVTLPLFKHNLHAFFMRWIPNYKLWNDLRLGDSGLRMIMPLKQNALPTSDGRVLIAYSDPARTVESLSQFSTEDAKRFAQALEEATRISETVIEPLRFSPPVPEDQREERLRRSSDGRRFMEISSHSALDFTREMFETEEIRALVLFTCALRGYLPVLDVPGTGYVALQAVAGAVNCLICEGGSFELARALAAQLYRAGGRAVTGDAVADIVVDQGGAAGVVLQSGKRIDARKAVVSSVPAPITLLELVGRRHLDASMIDQLESYTWNGEALFGVHLALEDAPSFGDPDDGAAAVNLCLGYEDGADVERDMLEVRAGKIPSIAALHASVPTRSDPSQAPAGMHTAFGWQFVPLRPEGRDASHWTEEESRRQLDEMVDTWIRYAPNVATAELARAAHSPLDTERLLPSMRLGDRHHGLYHPDNTYELRPSADLAQYRTPIDRLYLCGASSHPGGSVNGLPGYNAAGVVAADIGSDRWWGPVDARDALAALAE